MGIAVWHVMHATSPLDSCHVPSVPHVIVNGIEPVRIGCDAPQVPILLIDVFCTPLNETPVRSKPVKKAGA